MTTPTYIYKIVHSSAGPLPDPLPDRLPVSELDQKDGFIHLSTAKQVEGTLNRYFSGEQKIYLLRLDYSSVKDLIKWEDRQGAEGNPGGEWVFPHLYNGNQLGKKEIESVKSSEKKPGG
ncbi:hypothetical protein H1R20_g6881, partial [Candolleomyces eurysporus]